MPAVIPALIVGAIAFAVFWFDGHNNAWLSALLVVAAFYVGYSMAQNDAEKHD